MKLVVAAVLGVFVGGSASAQTVQSRLSDFDLNHDGRITRDEAAKGEAARFASLARGNAMTADQFAILSEQKARQYAARAFRRLDWNGDGKLSLDEYAGPQRARFAYFDRDGRGTESCAPIQNASFKARRGGRARFCADNDLNHDGNITHAEFDSVTARHFSSLAANAKFMTEAQFEADALARYRATDARIFRALDADHSGTLSLAEFSAFDRKLFDRLDRDKDGILTKSELSFHRSD